MQACQRRSCILSARPELTPSGVCCVLWSFIRMFPRCAGLVYGLSWYWYTHFTNIKSRADVLHAAVEPARTTSTTLDEPIFAVKWALALYDE
jgi:hypothetical protein